MFRKLHVPYGDRIPAGGLIDRKESALRYFAVTQPSHYSSSAQLDSGRFDFLHVVGNTDAERDWAKTSSTTAVIERLEAIGYAPDTDPQRAQLSNLD